MSLQYLHSDRLLLIPVTLEITRALLGGNKQVLEKFGVKADDGWPTEDTMDILPSIHDSLEKDKVPSGFEFWMIVKKTDRRVIGDIGFHGKPNENGEVEVGFGLVEAERGKGFGFEALRAIMDWLNHQESVKVVKADCLINNKPSARILEKAGMREVRRGQEFMYWEFVKPLSE